MWKGTAFVLIAGLLLIPFAAFADDAGVVGALLKIDHVFNLKLTDAWADLPITQAMIDSYFSLDPLTDVPIDWDAVSPNITVTVQALSDYEVYGSYTTTHGSDLTDTSAFIGLEGGGFVGPYLVHKDVPALGAPLALGDHGLTYAAISDATTGYTYLNWSGGNNLGTGAVSKSYDVVWNPLQLAGDFAAADQLDIRIFFLVADPTI